MSDKNNEIKTRVVVDSSQAQKGVEKLTDSTKDLSKGFAGMKIFVEKLDDATGGLLGKFKAIVKNPIGLTIAALVGLFKTMQGVVGRSSKASETFGKIGAKLSGIFNGFLAVLEPVVEFIGDKLLAALNDPKQAIIDLGNSIKENLINRIKAFLVVGKAFSALMNGELKKAAKLAADGVTQFATGVEDATGKMSEFGKEAAKRFKEAAVATNNLAGAEKALARNRIALEKLQLTSLRLAEEERQIRDDTSRSVEERLKANTKLGTILDTQLKKELSIAQQNLNLARARQAADGQTIESLEAVGDAEIKLLEIQERITGQRSEQLTNENALIKEREDLKKKAAEDADKQRVKEAEQAKLDKEAAEEKRQLDAETQLELDELELERLRLKGENTLALELEFLEKKRLQDVSAKDLTEKQIQVINEKSELAKQRLRVSSKKAELAKEKAILDGTINAAAEAFGVTQEVALARMLIAAPEAIGNSFKEAAKAYAPPVSLAMGAIGAAGVVIPIVQGINQIKNTRFSKKKGGAPGGGASPSISTGGGGASARSVTPELIGDISANNAARLGTDTNLGSGASATASNNVTGGQSASVVFSEGRYRDFQNQVQFKENKSTI